MSSVLSRDVGTIRSWEDRFHCIFELFCPSPLLCVRLFPFPFSLRLHLVLSRSLFSVSDAARNILLLPTFLRKGTSDLTVTKCRTRRTGRTSVRLPAVYAPSAAANEKCGGFFPPHSSYKRQIIYTCAFLQLRTSFFSSRWAFHSIPVCEVQRESRSGQRVV